MLQSVRKMEYTFLKKVLGKPLIEELISLVFFCFFFKFTYSMPMHGLHVCLCTPFRCLEEGTRSGDGVVNSCELPCGAAGN